MNHLRNMESEITLVTRAQNGCRESFEDLIAPYRTNLRNQAMRHLRNPEDAQDAVQEALLNAFRAIRSFTPGRPVLPWLSRICSNCCIDILRQRKHQNDPLEKYEFALASDEDLEQDAVDSLEDAAIASAVRRLPWQYRQILEMRHFQHMEVKEIAEELDKPEGTVKSWLFRARALLKKDLTPTLGAA